MQQKKKNLIFYNNKILKLIYKNIFQRSNTILPEHINLILFVHNGNSFRKLKITNKMVGYKFGSFINTRKKNIYKKNKKKK